MLRSLLLAALATLLLPLTAAAAEPSIRLHDVRITAPEGRLGVLVAPTPVIRTDAATATATIRVDNTSSIAGLVHIEVVDYVVDARGNAHPAPADHPFGSAAWYRLEATDFVLPPGTGRQLRLDVEPPATAAAGDHTASLDVTVRAEAASGASSGGVSVDTVLEVRTRLEHRVPGARPEMPALRLDASADGSTVRFLASVTNPGNTVLSYQEGALPAIELFNVSPWGEPGTLERRLQPLGFYVMPHAERLAAFDWTDTPIIASYRAVYTLPPIDGLPAVSAEASFTVINISVVAAAIGLVVGSVLVLLLLRRRRRPWRISRG